MIKQEAPCGIHIALKHLLITFQKGFLTSVIHGEVRVDRLCGFIKNQTTEALGPSTQVEQVLFGPILQVQKMVVLL